MRTFPNMPARTGNVIETRGARGGVISTAIVIDPKANGRPPGTAGYQCRDATPQEIATARANGDFKTVFC